MLAKLKARLKELAGQIKTFLDKEDLTAEEFAALEEAKAEVTATEARIKSLEEAEQIAARAALPAETPANPERAVPAVPATQLKTSEKIGLMCAAMAIEWLESKSGGHRAVMRRLDEEGYGSIAREFGDPAKKRALNSGGASAGGVLVPENMSSEIIDLLYPLTTFIQGGPRRVPLVGGNYKVPAGASGATAGWRGEGRAVAKSQPTLRAINMSAHYVDSLVPITNQLIRFSLPDVRAWVEQDMGMAMSVEIDRAAYVGEGTEYTPLGITKIPGVNRVTLTATGTAPTVAQIEADAGAAELVMLTANLPMLGAKWVMSSRTFIFLQNLRGAGTDQRIYPELSAANPTWRNKPVLVTEQVPTDGGDTTDESEIWLVAFGHVMFGEGLGITFNVSTEATVVTNGTAVSAFQNDLTYIKASAEADFDMRYLESVAVIPGVRWGA